MKFDKTIQVATAQNATMDEKGHWRQFGGEVITSVSCQVSRGRAREIKLMDGTVVAVHCEVYLPKRSPLFDSGCEVTVLSESGTPLFKGRVIESEVCKLSHRLFIGSVMTFDVSGGNVVVPDVQVRSGGVVVTIDGQPLSV